MASSAPLRRPNAKYIGKNGFTEEARTEREKEEVHAYAVELIHTGGVELPSADVIFNTDWDNKDRPPSSSSRIAQQIRTLRKRHSELLTRVYDVHAAAYADDVLDRYVCRNELLDSPLRDTEDLIQEERRRMEDASNTQKKLYTSSYPFPFSPTSPSPAHLPTISRHRHAHLTRLVHLRRDLEVEKEKEKERDKQEVYNRRRRQEEYEKEKERMEKERTEKERREKERREKERREIAEASGRTFDPRNLPDAS
ncbi:hypothetical protein EV361DRAFT_955186 [Lentinula raphanica]|nr:hypothetical protein F5880DRAFT_1343175 [Lentinula raphanica]KAJ3965267.1 hypothetical protein EV361DRAFT_955186 [Lentinula raphanica]